MSVYIELGIIALIPLCTSVALYFFFKKKELKYVNKQIIVGIIFGILAIVGTEFGVPLNGAVLNARDAAPLCAGLIFGAPAGVIAGLIGGIERFFCVYWGGGTYTRLACSIATVISGLLGAFLKKHMFDDKMPSWPYALGIGLVAETIHMTMVFVTHMDDIYKAFLVVKTCTAPMLVINSLAVTFAVFAIDKLDKEDLYDQKEVKITLAQQFQRSTLAIVIIAFFATSLFTLRIQNSISNADTKNLLTTNITDISHAVDDSINEELQNKGKKIKNEFIVINIVNEKGIQKIADLVEVDEINVVDKKGYIIYSNKTPRIGYNITNDENGSEFMCLTSTADEFNQPYNIYSFTAEGYKFAGIDYIHGLIMYGYNSKTYKEKAYSIIQSEIVNRHVGDQGDGGLVVVDSNGKVISNSLGIDNNIYTIDIDYSIEDSTIYETNVNGVECYVAQVTNNAFTILAYIPVESANFSSELSIFLDLFMETIVFGAIFIMTYFLLRYHVVFNIKGVNESLKKITEGDLNEVVHRDANQEFAALSNGINVTVDAMKKLIHEANERIDNELKYAKEIQTSSLPTYFEENPNYDLFASMNPAKEVGGDFYDFYLLNNKTLAICMADVSGKGIPAALFMMRAKSILKTYAEAGIAIADIFTNANFALCEGNSAGLFVTAWMGIVDLETGHVKFANAGHNAPCVKHKDGNYEFLKSKVGFVLGGMEGIIYKEQEFDLAEGDEIFLYTDGITEATNLNKELFGDDRLIVSLNKHCELNAEKLCNKIKEECDTFTGEAPQFDDMTMLSLKLHEFRK